mgnify:CR=1 FL=1
MRKIDMEMTAKFGRLVLEADPDCPICGGEGFVWYTEGKIPKARMCSCRFPTATFKHKKYPVVLVDGKTAIYVSKKFVEVKL